MIGHSQRANESEMYDQLHHHSAASMREKKSLGRLSVPEKNVLSVAQEHEEVTCSKS